MIFDVGGDCYSDDGGFGGDGGFVIIFWEYLLVDRGSHFHSFRQQQ